MDSITVRKQHIEKIILRSIETKQRLLSDPTLVATIDKVVESCVNTFRNDGQILFCGNGGSAADAQHLAAEFSGRFYLNRPPLNAEALHVNTSYLTAVANDYSYEEVYARILQAKGRQGDLLIALSTSGNSSNILSALETAGKLGMTKVGLSGNGGGKMAALCDLNIIIPETDTPRIQECHILVGHIICELVEDALFGKQI